MASCWIPHLLALEVSTTTRQTSSGARSPAIDPRDESCQPPLGRSSHSWRASEARDRYRPDLCGQVHGQAKAPSVTRLEDIPPQSCRRDRLDRSIRGSDDLV